VSDTPLVLVADDNQVNRLTVRATLKESPYDLVEAADGREVVDIAVERKPDLILMDLMMPEINGLEATRLLKSRDDTARIPILMLTALDDTDDRISAFEAGVTGFLNKPFDRLELLAHVRSYVNLSLINRRYVLSTANVTTGLPNRAAYREAIKGYERPWLFLISMDSIDSIRQFYGERRAQAMEREYAEYLQSVLAEDWLSRDGISGAVLYHFDSGLFGVLLDDDDGEKELTRAEARRRGRELHRRLNDYEVSESEVQWESDFTLVISSDPHVLLEQAELGLAEAQRSRRTLVYAPDVAEDAYLGMENNLRWLGRIRQALAQDRFTAYYQPIVDNRTGEIVKHEALLRLLDEDGSPISPGQFLLVAKNSKYYGEITRRVFQRAVEDFLHRPEGVSVNLSVLDIDSRATRTHILTTLGDYPEVARRMTLEIVEQEGLQHYDQVKEFIEAAKSLGATIALDDFGSGYSNFVRIVDLDVDFVKIDGSIITRVCSDEAMSNLVRGVKSFVAANGIELIAEFVENGEILDRLTDMGVEYSQGYFLGRPQPTPDSSRVAVTR
jgi:EAL domain-containing protein (putative c-di-GMP-specific phosphodiesterase class I)/AmiR/NasT family two-component response regulator